MDLYPIELFSTIETVIGVTIALVLAFWVAKKDQSARPIGFAAVMIGLVTTMCWFTNVSEELSWFTLFLIGISFITGMTAEDAYDDRWHYLALGIALFGKAVLALIPMIWDVLMGEVPGMPVLVFVLLVALTGALFAWLLVKVRFNRTHDEPVHGEEPQAQPA